MDVEDLIESMRSAGFYSLDDLDYAIFESNGKLSTKEKIDYDKKKTALPILLISDGKIITKNLDICGLTKEKLLKIIEKHGGKTVKRVGVMTIDGNGKVYFQLQKGNYQTFNVELEKGIKW